MQDYEIAARDFSAMLNNLGITIKARFIPFSQSRNASEKSPSLNWKCDILRNGAPILADVDYMQGNGHCPASKAKGRWPIAADKARAIAMECESGKRALWSSSLSRPYATRADVPAPSAADVLSSLAMDSDVLNYARFEEWAADMGMDPDSKKAESIYRLCIAHALALRAAIGDEALAKLCELAREM